VFSIVDNCRINGIDGKSGVEKENIYPFEGSVILKFSSVLISYLFP
jgi:hypothetical protein